MKKLKKLFLLSMCSFPLIMNANAEEEVIKNFIELEENIHYEKDVENICEYYDKNNYIIGDWIYSFEKPEEKEYREITEEIKEINLDTNIINKMRITSFDGRGSEFKLYEFVIKDKEGNKLDYVIRNLEYLNTELIEDGNEETYIMINRIPHIMIEFKEDQFTENIVIEATYFMEEPPFSSLSFNTYYNNEMFSNIYDNTTSIVENNCEEEICHIKVSTTENSSHYYDLSIKKNIYKYRDKYYKCFTPKTINLEEYVKELGYTKKTSNEEQTITNSLVTPNNNISNKSKEDEQLDLKPETKPKNVILEQEIQESVNKENEKLAILTKESKENTKNYIEIYIIAFILLCLIIIGIMFTKKVIKCRTK